MILALSADDSLREALDKFSLPTSFKYEVEVETIMAAMRGDKKSVKGTVRFVLPTGIGQVSVSHAVEEDQVRAALAELLIR